MSGMLFSRRLVWAIVLASVSLAAGWSETPAAAQPTVGDSKSAETNGGAPASDADPAAAEKALCTLIETSAAENGLPIGFFTRLIWKESRFRSEAVSPKGAQGIAQFMPGTAEERGLEDPFDTATAIPASARFLSDLKIRFGNLGLAAAAYNAGAKRVSDWLADSGRLPLQTQDYVLAVTGAAAETWADPVSNASLPAEITGANDCLALAALLRNTGAPIAPEIETARAPWGVQVAGGFSRALAIGAYSALKGKFPKLFADRSPMIVGGRMAGRGPRAFYRVRVPVETRTEGDVFCEKLKAAGGSCIVLKT